MNRTQKFIKNIIFTALAQIVTMLSGFIVPKIMLSYYGSEVNGLVSSINQVMTYLALIEGGLSGASIFALYKPLADKDTGKINGIVNATKKSYYKAGYILVSLVTVIAFVYPLLIETNQLVYWEIVFLFFIIAFNTVIDFFALAKYRALLTADQKTYILSIASTVQIILNAALIWLFSYLGFNIVIVRLIALASILLRSVILILYCRNHYKYLDKNIKPLPEMLDKKWDALFLQVLGSIHRGSPIIIATVMLSLNDVSVYSVYNMVLLGISSIMTIFTSGLQASFGDVLAQNQMDVFKKSFNQFETAYYFMTALFYSVCFTLIIPFVRVYVGDADINYIYPTLALLFCVNEYLYCLKTPQGMTVMSAGLYKETRWQTFTQGAICIVVGCVCCYFFGLPGILIGRIASNIYRDIDLFFFIPNQLKVLRKRETLVKWIVSSSLFAIGCVVGYFIPTDFISSYLSWLWVAVAVTASYFVVMFGVFFLCFRKDMLGLIKRFTGMLRRKQNANSTN